MSIAEHVAIQARFEELETKLVNLTGQVQHIIKRLDNLHVKARRAGEIVEIAEALASREVD